MMKGQINTVVTWIFGLIAGIVIFVLLISFGLNQAEQENYVTSTAVLENLEVQFRTIARSPNTFSELETPNINLNLICPDSDPDSSVMILEGGTSAKPTIFQTMFAPGNLKGRTIYAWARDWKVHTKVDSFLYLTDENTMFVFVGEPDEEPLNGLLEDFPAGIPHGVIRLEELIPPGGRYAVEGYDRYRFVLFDYTGDVTDIPRPPVQGNVTLVNINTSDEPNGHTIDFYESSSGNFGVMGGAVYDDDSLLFGAIFSETPGAYRCNAQKAVNRLNIWAELNRKRIANMTEELSSDYPACTSPGPECPECVNLMEDLPGEFSYLAQADYGDLNSISERVRNLASISTDLAKGRNCPTL